MAIWNRRTSLVGSKKGCRLSAISGQHLVNTLVLRFLLILDGR